MVRVKKSGEFDNRSPEGRKRNKRRATIITITTILLTIFFVCISGGDVKIILGGFLTSMIVSMIVWKVIFSIFNIFHDN